jgi:hypothetical protein
VSAENLRLFDPEPAQRIGPSGSETLAPLSRHETPTTPSHTETPAPETEHSTPANAALVAAADAALVAAAAAAQAARSAITQLDHAIAAARSDGHSWRTIAMATGIPTKPCTAEREKRTR